MQVGAELADGYVAFRQAVDGYGEIGGDANAMLKTADVALRTQAKLNGQVALRPTF